MDYYIKLGGGPLLTEAALQEALPMIGSPHCLSASELSALGYVKVISSPDPVVGDNQVLSDPQVICNAGVYYLMRTAIDKTPPTSLQINAPILAQLAVLDSKLPRSVEDLLPLLNINSASLPQQLTDTLAQKQTLRSQLVK